jgi:hydrogenase maturation protein HypF
LSTAQGTIPSIDAARRHRVRERLIVRGVVQGVGFRPFVYQLANELSLDGWVRNTGSGVAIEIEGTPQDIKAFRRRLSDDRPPNCVIQSIDSHPIGTEEQRGFAILNSSNDNATPACSIPPDLATCAQCLHEVFDPNNRRYHYPFTNCTACGPRYSLINALPYDRPNTTMQAFNLCVACRDEYNDPSSHRHHAQPNACPDCGPQLLLMSMTGKIIAKTTDALEQACDAIRSGQIVAVKGLGGFHLMVDAQNEDAVAELRRRKHRPTKPFAVMMRTLEQVMACCQVSKIEGDILCSASSPIVLLRRLGQTAAIDSSVAPGNPSLGVMLANTPLHHLMLDRLGLPVVATSGNLSNEPICIDEPEVRRRLGSIADLVLTHDRPIARAVDDSVVQVIDHAPRVLRRSRGYAPLQIPIPHHRGEPILAVGANQKNTVALACRGMATLSQHIGGLDSEETWAAQRKTTDDLRLLLKIRPATAVTDRHPDYESTRYAEDLGLPIRRVQHHAAHIYAAMAEHHIGPAQPVLGIACDGTGLGEDGTLWGGELLQIKGPAVDRVGHLEPFPLPGGDSAARKPSRSALGVLFAAFGDEALDLSNLAPAASIDVKDLGTLRQMLSRRINTPVTTSAGRLFDAVASLLDLCHTNTFEGEAAMTLQYAAESAPSGIKPLPIAITKGEPSRLDWRPAIREMVERIREGHPAAHLAKAFHQTLAQGWAQLVVKTISLPDPSVILTGGCFQNKLLSELCVSTLRSHGIEPLLHKDVPPNDGGIALGQLYAASLQPNVSTRRDN